MNNKDFLGVVARLQNTLDKNGNKLNLDSIIISQGASFFKHNFKNSSKPNDLRSLSKSIVALTIGIAIDSGLKIRDSNLNLETKIFPFFKDKVKINNFINSEYWEQVTLKHLLTHSIGYPEGLLFSSQIKSKDPFSLIEYIFNVDIVAEPGTKFVYSNVGPYIISALIQEELGMNLSDWVNQLLFKKIDIHNYEWRNYGKYCAGATGLKLYHDDLHKIGEILINKGIYKNERIVSETWIELMSTFQISTINEFSNVYDTSRVFPKWGYGFYVYICEDGNFYVDGTDGQYLIVLKEKGILITTFGHQPDMKPITECFRELL